MLNCIPRIITPELLNTLNDMGEGDEIALIHANAPVYCRPTKVIRVDDTETRLLMEAILLLIPLNEDPRRFSCTLPEFREKDAKLPDMVKEYKKIIQAKNPAWDHMEYLSESNFYERVKRCYAAVLTGELQQDSNIILCKGNVVPLELHSEEPIENSEPVRDVISGLGHIFGSIKNWFAGGADDSDDFK